MDGPASASVFLSYSKVDSEQVTRLDAALRAAGFQVWFDERNLLPGQSWELEIARALRRAKVILVCVSSQALTRRGYFQKEIRIAIELMAEIPEGEVLVVPVRLDDCEVPESLRGLHWANVWNRHGLESLAASISSNLALGDDDAATAAQTVLRNYFEGLPKAHLGDRIRKLERVSALWEHVITSESEIKDLFFELLDVLEVEQGFVAFVDEQDYLRILVCKGKYWHLPSNAGASGRAFVTNRVHVVEASKNDAFRKSGWSVASEIVAPILLHGRSAGVILVDRFVPKAFERSDIALLTDFSRRISNLVT